MNKIHLWTSVVVICFALGGAPAVSASAQGTAYLFEFDHVFGTDAPPSGSSPWVAATVQDVSPGGVLLTITNTGLIDTEFTSEVYFNLNPILDPNLLTFHLVASDGDFAAPRIDHNRANSYKAGGDGMYDIRVGFRTARAHRFSSGESLTYQITGSGIDSDLVAADFCYLSTSAGGLGSFYAAAHVQGMQSAGSDSTWISTMEMPTLVPEPTLGALLALTFGLWGGVHWLARRQASGRSPDSKHFQKLPHRH